VERSGRAFREIVGLADFECTAAANLRAAPMRHGRLPDAVNPAAEARRLAPINDTLRRQGREIMAELQELQLTLTSDECEYLVNLLENVLKDTRIEEHRTRTPSYREHVLHQEELIVALLSKLGHPTA
jgi:tRNA(Ile)-lysidine synthase TilS/MesJ